MIYSNGNFTNFFYTNIKCTKMIYEATNFYFLDINNILQYILWNYWHPWHSKNETELSPKQPKPTHHPPTDRALSAHDALFLIFISTNKVSLSLCPSVCATWVSFDVSCVREWVLPSLCTTCTHHTPTSSASRVPATISIYPYPYPSASYAHRARHIANPVCGWRAFAECVGVRVCAVQLACSKVCDQAAQQQQQPLSSSSFCVSSPPQTAHHQPPTKHPCTSKHYPHIVVSTSLLVPFDDERGGAKKTTNFVVVVVVVVSRVGIAASSPCECQMCVIHPDTSREWVAFLDVLRRAFCCGTLCVCVCVTDGEACVCPHIGVTANCATRGDLPRRKGRRRRRRHSSFTHPIKILVFVLLCWCCCCCCPIHAWVFL